MLIFVYKTTTTWFWSFVFTLNSSKAIYHWKLLWHGKKSLCMQHNENKRNNKKSMFDTILRLHIIRVLLASSQQQFSHFAASTNTSTSVKSMLHSPSFLLGLKHVDLAGIFQSLSTVTEPDPNHLAVVVQLLGDLCNLLARRKRVFFEVSVEDLDGLRREAGSPFTFLGRFSSHELHQVLLTFLVPELGLGQPALQHRLQLLRTFRSDVQLLKPGKVSINTRYWSGACVYETFDPHAWLVIFMFVACIYISEEGKLYRIVYI